MRNFGHEAQKTVEAHLDGCFAALDDDSLESPASAPFCGCDTCCIRESLHAAWKLVDAYMHDALAAGQEEIRRLNHENASLEEETRGLRSLIIEHHVMGATEGLLVGDRCRICASSPVLGRNPPGALP